MIGKLCTLTGPSATDVEIAFESGPVKEWKSDLFPQVSPTAVSITLQLSAVFTVVSMEFIGIVIKHQNMLTFITVAS